MRGSKKKEGDAINGRDKLRESDVLDDLLMVELQLI
jgi:hypothetical protein